MTTDIRISWGRCPSDVRFFSSPLLLCTHCFRSMGRPPYPSGRFASVMELPAGNASPRPDASTGLCLSAKLKCLPLNPFVVLLFCGIAPVARLLFCRFILHHVLRYGAAVFAVGRLTNRLTLLLPATTVKHPYNSMGTPSGRVR